MTQVTRKEYEKIVSKWYRGEIKSDILRDYEIVCDFELTGNKIADSCTDMKIKENGNKLYYGGHIVHDSFAFRNYVMSQYNVQIVFWDAFRCVLSDIKNLFIYSYCEGDIFAEKFNSIDGFNSGIEEEKIFYKEH